MTTAEHSAGNYIKLEPSVTGISNTDFITLTVSPSGRPKLTRSPNTMLERPNFAQGDKRQIIIDSTAIPLKPSHEQKPKQLFCRFIVVHPSRSSPYSSHHRQLDDGSIGKRTINCPGRRPSLIAQPVETIRFTIRTVLADSIVKP